MVFQLFPSIARSMPSLKGKLKRAGLQYRPEDFIKRTFLTATYLTVGVVFAFGLILQSFGSLNLIFFLSIPVAFGVFFFYFLKYPDVRISKKEKEVAREIVFAGRHLIIELESGVPLYNALVNLSRNYESVGKYFRAVTDKVDLGTSIEDALTDAVELSPSNDLRRLLWQILNSMQTGSEISKSLGLVMEQIAREQTIQVNEYGRKLNPLAMFYMIIAVILPSLGITLLIILSSFMNFHLSLSILLVIAAILGFLQFMFLSIIRFSRPAVEF